MFLPEDGARDGITLVHLLMVSRKVYAEIYALGSGGWGVPGTAVIEVEHPHGTTFLEELLPPVHGKVFMVRTSGYILGLDLATSTFFTLELPVGVRRSYLLSCADDSGLYLVSAAGFQLSVWLNGMTGDGHGAAGWLLVDTFSIREGCTRFADQNQTLMPQDGDFLRVAAVGDNAEFVFLDYATYGVVLYVHLRSRVVEKVYEQAPYDHETNPGRKNYELRTSLISGGEQQPLLTGGSAASIVLCSPRSKPAVGGLRVTSTPRVSIVSK
uniref:F-box protein AT5G49610-like beta-propeller domain-containing protein n=1 Tax=Aegilops tauschii TaxID=37682 RepID=R7WBJ8_AEGTA